MQIKFTPQFQAKLEDIFAESDYVLRYEKGNFHAGYCILKDTKIAIVNKYFTPEGKINCLIEILKSIELDISRLSDKNRQLYLELTQSELKF
jgi:hypothetical protein